MGSPPIDVASTNGLTSPCWELRLDIFNRYSRPLAVAVTAAFVEYFRNILRRQRKTAFIDVLDSKNECST